MIVIGQLALVVAVGALAGASWRAARALGASGLELPVAAAPIGAATAGISSLGLGLLGLGGSWAALTLAAVGAWLLARRLWPAAAAPEAWAAAAGWWAARSPRERLVLGAVIGAGAAWVAWIVRHPGLGVDPLTYHLPESILWVQQGHPGSVETLQYEFPQGYYPVTNELLVAWLTGISWTFAPGLLWTAATCVLAATAAWLGLRRIGGEPLVSGFAIAAVLLTPIACTQLIGAHTDLPAIAWLYASAALVAAAGREPRLLAPALVAAALAIGTKTTAAPLIALLFGWAAWRHRARLRSLAPLLAGAFAVGTLVGGLWYIRNLIEHGSPLWPFVATSFGDPMPDFLDRLDVRFLDRPSETLERNGVSYAKTVAGGWIVLLAGLAAPLVAFRRRGVLVAFAVTLVAGLSWMNAPFTGAADDVILDVSATTIRYLLPTISVAAVALVLAVAGRRALGIAVSVALALGCAWSVAATQDLTLLAIPGTGTLVGGAVVGAGIVWALTRRPLRLRRLPAAAVSVAVAVVSALALVAVAQELPRRQGGAYWLRSAGLVTWAAAQPSWRDEDFPIAFAPEIIATLAGDRLEHDIALLDQEEPCAAVHARARRGWVVLGTFPFADKREQFTAAECLRAPPAGTEVIYRDELFTVFAPARTAE